MESCAVIFLSHKISCKCTRSARLRYIVHVTSFGPRMTNLYRMIFADSSSATCEGIVFTGDKVIVIGSLFPFASSCDSSISLTKPWTLCDRCFFSSSRSKSSCDFLLFLNGENCPKKSQLLVVFLIKSSSSLLQPLVGTNTFCFFADTSPFFILLAETKETDQPLSGPQKPPLERSTRCLARILKEELLFIVSVALIIFMPLKSKSSQL